MATGPVEKYPGNQRSEKRGLQIRNTSDPRWLQNPWETSKIPRGRKQKRSTKQVPAISALKMLLDKLTKITNKN